MANQLTEDSFFDSRIQRAIQVYLINGIKLVGVLQGHHADVVFLLPHGARAEDMQMISKCAISTIASGSSNIVQSPADDLEDVLSRARRNRRGVRGDEL